MRRIALPAVATIAVVCATVNAGQAQAFGGDIYQPGARCYHVTALYQNLFAPDVNGNTPVTYTVVDKNDAGQVLDPAPITDTFPAFGANGVIDPDTIAPAGTTNRTLTFSVPTGQGSTSLTYGPWTIPVGVQDANGTIVAPCPVPPTTIVDVPVPTPVYVPVLTPGPTVTVQLPPPPPVIHTVYKTKVVRLTKRSHDKASFTCARGDTKSVTYNKTIHEWFGVCYHMIVHKNPAVTG